jgi:hypothetical protein
MAREQRWEKRYRRQAARATAKRPNSVSFTVPGQLLRWAHQSPWSDSPLYHDPGDLRVDLAIRAFHDCDYRLVREEPASVEGSVGGVSFKERAVTLVFVPADAMSNELPTPTRPREMRPKRARLMGLVGLVCLCVFVVFAVIWVVLGMTGHDEGSFYISVLAVLFAMVACVSIIRIIYETHTEDSQSPNGGEP